MNRDAADAPVVSAVEATAYTIPTDQPEADGTIAWDDTTIVVVRVHADGVVGTGWTYGSAAIASLVEQTLAPVVTGTNALANVATWSRLVRALRNVGRPGVAGMGLSAVDCALWDLKARLLALPLHRLLGADRDQVPLYGSGGFTTYGRDRLERQLRGWVEDAGMRAVKIKIGESWGTRVDRDLDRVRQARDVIGPDVELFVDANGGYTVGQAVRVGRTLDDTRRPLVRGAGLQRRPRRAQDGTAWRARRRDGWGVRLHPRRLPQPLRGRRPGLPPGRRDPLRRDHRAAASRGPRRVHPP